MAWPTILRPVQAVEIGKAGDANEAHRHADRHAHEHHPEQGNKSDDGDGVGAQHGLFDRLHPVAAFIHQFRTEDQPIGAHRDQHHR